MKRISKYIAAVAGLTVLAVAAFSMSPVLADSPGQLEGGSAVYEVKDVTQNGAYATTISAKAGDEVEYSVEIHNGAYGSLSDVVVRVDLPSNSATSNTSTMTATTSDGGTTGTTGTTTVNLNSAETITYTSGTTELFNEQGAVIEKLPDTITSNGVDIGAVNGSTTEFVNFEARVSTPVVPTPPAPCGTCNLLSLIGTEPTFTANAHYTVTNGASVKGVTFNWGDGTTVAGGTIANGTTVITSAPHTYATPGTYKVVATVSFNSTGAAVANSSCSASVTIPKPPVTPTPPVTPPATPVALVNTGPGDVIALFAVTTVVGAVAHRLYGRRSARS